LGSRYRDPKGHRIGLKFMAPQSHYSYYDIVPKDHNGSLETLEIGLIFRIFFEIVKVNGIVTGLRTMMNFA